MSSIKRCAICGKYSLNGINIMNNTICFDCEKDIIKTNVSNKKYDEYKDKIKNLCSRIFISELLEKK